MPSTTFNLNDYLMLRALLLRPTPAVLRMAPGAAIIEALQESASAIFQLHQAVTCNNCF